MRILREAEDEAKASAIWYDDQLDGLGGDFLDELSAAFQQIEDDTHRFPYLIIFEILDEETVVLAVAHSKRRPDYWRKRV